MSYLYISEGTFNRQRRKALLAVANALLEAKKPMVAPAMSRPAHSNRRVPTDHARALTGHAIGTELLAGQ